MQSDLFSIAMTLLTSCDRVGHFVSMLFLSRVTLVISTSNGLNFLHVHAQIRYVYN